MEAAKVEGFSDGVFGVAMTLLVYQLVTPGFDEGKSNSELLNDLENLWPYYLSLFISFFTILIMWINHHGIFRLVHRIDSRFMFANGFLLFLVILVPYPTLLVSKFLLTPSAKTACAVYAAVFLIINLAYNWLWFPASHNRKLLIANITDKKNKISYKKLPHRHSYLFDCICSCIHQSLCIAYNMPVAMGVLGKKNKIGSRIKSQGIIKIN